MPTSAFNPLGYIKNLIKNENCVFKMIMCLHITRFWKSLASRYPRPVYPGRDRRCATTITIKPSTWQQSAVAAAPRAGVRGAQRQPSAVAAAPWAEGVRGSLLLLRPTGPVPSFRPALSRTLVRAAGRSRKNSSEGMDGIFHTGKKT
jgi:hypothetical protein